MPKSSTTQNPTIGHLYVLKGGDKAHLTFEDLRTIAAAAHSLDDKVVVTRQLRARDPGVPSDAERNLKLIRSNKSLTDVVNWLISSGVEMGIEVGERHVRETKRR